MKLKSNWVTSTHAFIIIRGNFVVSSFKALFRVFKNLLSRTSPVNKNGSHKLVYGPGDSRNLFKSL